MRVLAGFSIVVVLTACYSSSQPEPETCEFGQYLHVENQTGEQVEVFAVKGSAKTDIGTVGSGLTDLTIPGDNAKGYSFQGYGLNGRIIGAFGDQSRAARLLMTPKCMTHPPIQAQPSSTPRRPPDAIEKAE